MARCARSLREAPGAPDDDAGARYSGEIPRLVHLTALALALALAAALAACGGSSGPNAADTVAQPPLTGTRPATTSTPPPAATSTSSATTPATATATTPTTTATAPPATHTSTAANGATGGAQAGCPNAVGGFIRDLQARGTDCGRARDVATAWFGAVHSGAAPTSQVSAAGYACGATMSGERAAVSCSGGGGTISFTASP
jgi:hypothetical protein